MRSLSHIYKQVSVQHLLKNDTSISIKAILPRQLELRAIEEALQAKGIYDAIVVQSDPKEAIVSLQNPDRNDINCRNIVSSIRLMSSAFKFCCICKVNRHVVVKAHKLATEARKWAR